MTNKTKSPNDTTFNAWWLSLCSEERKVLMEDKWLLSNRAFEAGKKLAKTQTSCACVED